MPSSSTTPAAAAAAAARTVRLLVDGPGKRVLLAEADEAAAAFLSALLAKPVRAALQELLREEDPASAAAGCFGNLAAASEALLPLRGTSTNTNTSSYSHAPPRAGMGIMARRIFRCGHLGCRCSDVASREAGSACPCASPSCRGGGGSRDTELYFLEPCFYRRPDGSAAPGGAGDTFYRCRARDERRGRDRDVFPCRFRVTDERGVVCPLCNGQTAVEVRCPRPGDDDDNSSVSARRDARKGGEDGAPTTTTTSYAIMDDLSVRPVAAGLSAAALLSALGVAADAADVREETVPFGYKEGLRLLEASLRSKTALTDVFLPAVAPAARRRRRR